MEHFFLLQNDPALIARRQRGNMKAAKQLRLAKKIAWLLAKFPYVRGVAVSGSLSKNFADEESDIDFFIITEKNRLWITRTLMHIFKKFTYLAGKQHWFCMNYYIDEQGLEIKEKNIFTAMEIVTLLPLYDETVFEKFFQANRWTSGFFPLSIPPKEVLQSKKGFIKKITEKLLFFIAGNRIDNFLMSLTLKRWHHKTMRLRKNYHGGLMGMDGTRHYAKPEPAHFQEKILRKYEQASELLIEQFMIRDQAMDELSFLRREIM